MAILAGDHPQPEAAIASVRLLPPKLRRIAASPTTALITPNPRRTTTSSIPLLFRWLILTLLLISSYGLYFFKLVELPFQLTQAAGRYSRANLSSNLDPQFYPPYTITTTTTTTTTTTFSNPSSELWLGWDFRRTENLSEIIVSVLAAKKSSGQTKKIDLLWTWSNQTSNSNSDSYLYREHDELRFSLRSSLDAFKDHSIINSRQILIGTPCSSLDHHHISSVSLPNWYVEPATGTRSENTSLGVENPKKTSSLKFRPHHEFFDSSLNITLPSQNRLHSFIMVRSDLNKDGYLSRKEIDRMIQELRTSRKSNQRVIRVFKPHRNRTRLIDEVFNQDITSKPKQTEYEWLSSDGYFLIKGLKGHDNSEERLLDYDQKKVGEDEVVCEIDLNECFWTSEKSSTLGRLSLLRIDSSRMLKRVAFEKPQCGDCLIVRLIGKESIGLNSFLPKPNSGRLRKMVNHQVTEDTSKNPSQSITSMSDLKSKKWQSTVFYNRPPSKGMDVRNKHERGVDTFLLHDRLWSINNIQKYQYVLGQTKSQFISLTNAYQSRVSLNKIENQIHNPSSSPLSQSNSNETSQKDKKEIFNGLLITINDQIYTSEVFSVDKLFKKWMNRIWNHPAPWEKIKTT